MEARTKEKNIAWEEMYREWEADGVGRTELWEGDIPNFDLELGQKRPTLAIPKIHKGRGIIVVCAGGGFRFKSVQEGRPVAEFFYARGLNAAVLDYRVQPYTRLDSCADGLRAVRWLRHNAETLGIPADKIAIGGFSAGGMLSALAATSYDDGNPEAADPVERVSSRPDAALIWYGAFSSSSTIGAVGGYDLAKQNELARYDPLRRLRSDCPPFFLFQTHKDDPRLCMQFGLELGNRGIPFEVHTFREGPHGAGLYDGKHPNAPLFAHTARWAELAAEWLEGYGFYLIDTVLFVC
jgi:acetyl esterase/lipase